MAIVVEINTDLFARMDAIASQYGCTARCNPHTGQCICIHFVLFNQTLALFMHVNATMLTVMDLIVSHDWIAGRSNLNASQCIAINVIVLD